MKPVGTTYMSRRQKASLVEPQSLQEARQTITAATVQKLFPATEDFAGGTFNGNVAGVDGKIAQEDGSILSGVFYRVEYEDGDAEHLLWPELKEILLSLPAKNEDEPAVTPAIPSKSKHAAPKTAGAGGVESLKKQKVSPAAEPAGAESLKKRKVSPVAEPAANFPDAEDQALQSVDKQLPPSTRGTRSKRQRSAKAWLGTDENDENDAQAANTPVVRPTTAKKLRIFGPTPTAGKTTVQREAARSTVKKEFGKSAIKQEVKMFVLEDRAPADGSPGQLKKVKLVNFMCHGHFEMDFCPHINFVSGQNGSGKSAVLQAIQQVLGVRASATNRASTQKEFIRKGAHEAVISVTLWNKGEDAYQPEKWGSSITIERRIGQSSSWSMKDAKGRKREENRASLDGILEALNLNGSNPIAVMTQDISRSFLAGSNEKADRKKFDIYMEATLLAQSQENYQMAKADLAKIAVSLNQAQQVYKALKARRAELSKAVEALQLMGEWQEEETQVMRGLAWAAVADMEPKLHRMEQSILHTLPGKLQKIQGYLEPAHRKVEELEKQYQDQLASMAGFNGNLDHISNETRALQKVHLDAKTKFRQETQKVDSLKADIAELMKEREDMVNSVAQTQQTSEFLATQAANDQLQEQLTQQQQACEAAHADEQAKEQAFREAFERQKEAVKVLEGTHEPKTKQLGLEISEMTENMAGLKHGAVNRLNLFGTDTSRILHVIQRRAKDFHRKPVGPVGAYLSLSDHRWGQVAETHRLRLETYVLHDHHDLAAFKRGCQQLKIPVPPVTISNFDVPQHTIPAGKRPPADIVSLLDVLRCTDKKMAHVVMNHVVDGAYAEKTALCESLPHARYAAAQPQVWNAYVQDGSRFQQKGQTTTLFPGGRHKFLRLGGDIQAEIEGLQSHMREKQAEIDVAMRERQRAEAHAVQCRRDTAAAKTAKAAAVRSKNDVDSQYAELLSQSEADMSVTKLDEGEIEREIRELSQNLLQMQQELMSAQAECDRAQSAEQDALSTWEAKRNEGSQLEDDNARITSDIELQRGELEEGKAQLQYYTNHQVETEQKLEALKASQESANKMLASNSEKAVQVCSREEADAALECIKQKLLEKGMSEEAAEQSLSLEALTQALSKLRAKMTHQEKKNGGKGEDILLMHAEVQSQCKEHKDRLQKLQNTYHMLRTACDKRMSDLNRIDRALEESVNSRFNFYMYKKGHTGMIKVKRATEEKSGTLEIKVRIGGNAANTGNVKDLKQLSGGEKSYTTVAFSLALGEWTQSPFRAMDEFDVFMDAVNRRVAMENLFSNSLEQPDLQFIFLTPQDINAVEEAKKNLAARGSPMPEGYCQVVLMRPARDA